MKWSLHEIPIQLAVDQGLVEKINKASGRNESRQEWLDRMRAECIDEEQWNQEYCCIPADENTAFITYDMITACEDPHCLKPFDYLLACENPLYLGMDVARKRHLCVIDVGEKIGDIVYDRYRLEMLDQPYSKMEEELYRLLALPNMQRACIDCSSFGDQLSERAAERFPWIVEGYRFTNTSKETLAYGLHADFSDHKLRIPHDEKLRADLRAIRKEVTASGKISFAGESDGSHCDRFWAKALRQYATRTQNDVGAEVG
jgi:phage FluMu gp28-like protein